MTIQQTIDFWMLLKIIPLMAFFYVAVFDTPDAYKFFDRIKPNENEILFGIRCTLFSFCMALQVVLVQTMIFDVFYHFYPELK